MQSNTTYLASATISQYDLLTIDTSSSTATALCCKPASSDDVIIGRANSSAGTGEPVNLGELSVGTTFTCVAGESISAGDFLGANSGKAVKGGTELMAIENASVGGRFRAILVEQEVDVPEPPEPVESFDPLSMVPEYNADSGFAPTLAVGDLIELGWAGSSNVYPGQEINGTQVRAITYETRIGSVGNATDKAVVTMYDLGAQYNNAGYKFKVIRGARPKDDSTWSYSPILCMVSAVPASN